MAEDCLVGAKIKPVFSLTGRTRAALSALAFEHMLVACRFLDSFAAVALKQSNMFFCLRA